MPKTGRKSLNIREQFYRSVTGQNGEALKECTLCLWRHVDNGTRLREHMEKRHPERLLEEGESKQKQASIIKYGDRGFTPKEQENAEIALALFQVSSASAFTALEGEAFKTFCGCLRQNFKVPSRYKLIYIGMCVQMYPHFRRTMGRWWRRYTRRELKR